MVWLTPALAPTPNAVSVKALPHPVRIDSEVNNKAILLGFIINSNSIH